MRNITLVVIALLACLKLNAQEQAALTLHYNAYNYFHPGVEIGYQLPILNKLCLTDKGKSRWYQVNLHPNLATYYHRKNHTGLLLGSDLQLKTTSNGGYEFQVFGGGHYLRTVLNNKTFTKNNSGSFEEVKFPGNNHFQWRAGVGIGMNLLPKYEKSFSIYLKAGVSQPNLPGSPVVPNLWLGFNYAINSKQLKL